MGTTPGNYGVTLTDPSEPVLQKFRRIGERLIGVPSRDSQKREGSNVTVSFWNKDFALAMGDFRKEEWPRTLDDQYSWMYEDDHMLWRFVEGLFDTRARIHVENKRKYISFSTWHLRVADKFIDIFARLGIERATNVYDSAKREGIQSVTIYNKPDLKLFAGNITSANPDKQAKLDEILALPVERNIKGIPREELIAEYEQLTVMFGRRPTPTEITRLHRERPPRTRYSVGTYINYFGATGSDTPPRWSQAVEVLGGLVPEPDPKAAIEVFPPKPETKKDKLLAFMEKELERGRQGYRLKVDSDLDLAEMFGTNVQTVRAYLREAGIGAEWRRLRNQQNKPTRRPRISEAEVLAEWAKLTTEYGSNISPQTIADLRGQKPPGTRFSAGLYTKRFGESAAGDPPSFLRAREVLNRRVREASQDPTN